MSKPRFITDEEADLVLAMRRNGFTWTEIANKVGRSKNFLCKRFREGSTYSPKRKTYRCSNCSAPTNSARKICNAEECAAVYAREYQRENRTVFVYGLSSDDIRRILVEQNYTCLLCPAAITFETRHVDHDHATGKFRGLLCNKCNRGLGFFNDDPDHLRLAAEYIESSRNRSNLNDGPLPG